MTVNTHFRDHTNWHVLHCDHPGCHADFTVDGHYGDLGNLRRIAATTYGWTSPNRDGDTPAKRRDFCPRHATTPLRAV